MPEKKSANLLYFFSVLLLGLMECDKVMAQESQSLSKAPPQIIELSKQLEGKKPQDCFKIIQNKFGAPGKFFDTFSGRTGGIGTWFIEGGVLTCDNTFASVLFESKTLTIDLIRPPITVSAGIIGDFSMDSAPTPPYGNCDWMGQLRIDSEHNYIFRDVANHTPAPGEQRDNFLTVHPRGSVTISYAKGITSDTILQDLPDNTTLAELVFTAADGSKKETQSYSVVSTKRVLHFQGGDSAKFQLSMSWPRN